MRRMVTRGGSDISRRCIKGRRCGTETEASEPGDDAVFAWIRSTSSQLRKLERPPFKEARLAWPTCVELPQLDSGSMEQPAKEHVILASMPILTIRGWHADSQRTRGALRERQSNKEGTADRHC